MKSIVIDRPFKARTDTSKNMPSPKEGEALLKMLVGGICGSDLATYRGISAYVSYPRTIGHEFAAQVIQLPCDYQGPIKEGMIVTGNPYFNCGHCYSCRRGFVNACENNETMGVQREGAFSEYFTMPVERVYDGSGIKAEELALIEPFCISHHGISRANVQPGDKVLIFGCGAIGILAGVASKYIGAKVYISDIAANKVTKAINDFHFDGGFVNDSKEKLEEFKKNKTNGDGFDVTVEAAGSPTTFLNCIDATASRGRMVQIGVPQKNADFNFREIQRKELNIYGSRAATKDDFMETMKIVREGKADLTKLISRTYPIEDAGAAFKDLDQNASTIIKAEFDFRNK